MGSIMKIFISFILSILLYQSFLNAKDIIYFTPLPMNKTKKNVKEFLPLIDFLKKELSVDIKFNNQSNYTDILKGFENKTIDMAFLGPLPYAVLKSKYPYIKPIVSFKQKNGSVYYRCVLSKFATDTIDTSKPLKIALTQPLSTCGYFMSKKLLKQKYNLDLKAQYYKYTMSHINAVTGALKGKFDLAGSTEMIANKFKSLGMQIVAKSKLLPGFSIVVNTKTLSKDEIKSITDALLKISDAKFKEWNGKIQYGLQKANEASYKNLKINYKIPQKGNML
jgi:phosphonate transport system substrate-binding protein